MKRSGFFCSYLLSCLCVSIVASCIGEDIPQEKQKVMLQTPEVVLGEVGFNSVKLNWSPVSGAVSYNIYYDGDEYPEMSIDTFVVLTGLRPLTGYSVCVSAVPASQSDFLESGKSQSLTFRTSSTPRIDKPSVSITELLTTGFMAQWSPVDKAGSYTVVLSDAAARVDSLSIAGDTSHVWTGLVPGTAYTLSVTAVPSEDFLADWDSSEAALVNVSTPVPGELPSPSVKIERATYAETVFSWDEVPGAGSYLWKLDDAADATSVTGLSAKVGGLEPGSDHVLHIMSCSADKDVNADSKWIDVSFKVAMPEPLAAPVLTVNRASCYLTMVSWEADADAAGYEWKMDTEDVTATDQTSVSFEGLAKGSHHVLSVRKLSSDAKSFMDSDWTSVEFDAADDFASSLVLSSPEVADDKAKFTATVKSGEEFYMGFALKGMYLDGDGQVDGDALIAEVLADLSDKADQLVSAGTYATKREALASLVRNKSTRLTSGVLCHCATYLCYAFDVNVIDCTAMSELQYLEVATPAHVAAGASFCTDPLLLSLTAGLKYSVSSSSALYDNTNYVAFSIGQGTEPVPFTEVRYTIMSLSTYTSTFGTSSVDEGVSEAVRTYFNTKGSVMSSSYVNSLNDGNAYTSAFSGRSANTDYVVMARGVTEDGTSVVAVSSVRTCSKDSEWLKVTSSGGGKFKISSVLPVASGKYSCVTLSSSNNTPELAASYMSDHGTAMSDARVAAVNGDGAEISYTSLTSGKTYLFIVQATSVAGDTMTVACPYKAD